MNYLPSLLISLALLEAMPAVAEKADRDKPMNAEADALRYDDLKQSSVFTGNVIITKGTTLIRGARVRTDSNLMCRRQPTLRGAHQWSQQVMRRWQAGASVCMPR